MELGRGCWRRWRGVLRWLRACRAAACDFHGPAGTSCPVQELIATEARDNIVIEVGGFQSRAYRRSEIRRTAGKSLYRICERCRLAKRNLISKLI